MASKIRSYCVTMNGCNPVDVETACQELARVDSPFIPAAGQIYAAAQRAAARRVAKERAATPRLPRPPRGIDAVPEREREAMRLRLGELVKRFKSEVAH